MGNPMIQVKHCPEVDDARDFGIDVGQDKDKTGLIIRGVGMFSMYTNSEPVSDKIFTYKDFINMVNDMCK